jgi:hypothetical protein
MRFRNFEKHKTDGSGNNMTLGIPLPRTSDDRPSQLGAGTKVPSMWPNAGTLPRKIYRPCVIRLLQSVMDNRSLSN